MLQFIDSSSFIRFVFNSGMIITAMTIAMMAFIIFFRYWSVKKDAEIKNLIKRWENIFDTIEKSFPDNLPNISKKTESYLLIKLWTKRFKDAGKEEADNLLKLAKNLQFRKIVIEMLKHKNGNYKIIAIEAAGYLKDKKTMPLLYDLLEHKNPFFSLLSAQSLVTISQKDTIGDVIGLYLKKEDWIEQKVIDILSHVDKRDLHQLLKSELQRSTPNQMTKLLKLFVLIKKDIAYSISKEIISKQSDADVIAEALLFINKKKDKDLLLSYIGHSSWKVRFSALSSAANFLSIGDINKIALLMSDKVWKIRQKAAQILVSKSFSTNKYLNELSLTLVDPYSKEALNYARNKRDFNVAD